MGIYMVNDASDINNVIKFQIVNEHIARGVRMNRLVGTKTLPARNIGDFLWLFLCANQDGSGVSLEAVLDPANTGVVTPPARDVTRHIACWGTVHDNPDLMRQIQVGNLVQYNGDYPFVPNFVVHFFNGGNWTDQPIFGAYPKGATAAYYCRAEAQTFVDDGTGRNLNLGQANVGGFDITPGVSTTPSMGFVTQSKGLSRVGQPDVSNDHMRVVVDPLDDNVYLRAGTVSEVVVQFGGYELIPT